MSLTTRFKDAYNAFMNKDPTIVGYRSELGSSFSVNEARAHFTRGNEKSIVTSVMTRIAVDISMFDFRHVTLDESDKFIEEVPSGLNNIFKLSANLDQSSRAFMIDFIISMLDEGVAAMVPIETEMNKKTHEIEDVYTMRTAKVVDWYSQHIKANVYDEREGRKKEIIVPKASIPIVENPFYSVMNEYNSTAQRLKRKLILLDNIDEMNGSNKLNIIIQSPYIIKSDHQKNKVNSRMGDIMDQLKSNEYGIAYTDGTEKIVQLNRAIESNLLPEIESLTSQLYSQLGITKEVMDGTANADTMNNYYTRTLEPIATAIVDECKRKLLTEEQRSKNHQSIVYFRDPFKMLPIGQVPDFADKLTRNEVMTSNEVRQKIGLKPSDDPAANELRNKNMPVKDDPGAGVPMDDEQFIDDEEY